MYAFKTLSFAFLLLVASVQAGRITYNCYDKTGGINKSGKNEQKLGGTITDAQEKAILANMHTWSNGKYSASVHKITKILGVKCVESVANKNLATAANNEQEQLVNKNSKTKRDNDVDDDDDDDDDVVVDNDMDNASDEDVPEYAY